MPNLNPSANYATTQWGTRIDDGPDTAPAEFWIVSGSHDWNEFTEVRANADDAAAYWLELLDPDDEIERIGPASALRQELIDAYEHSKFKALDITKFEWDGRAWVKSAPSQRDRELDEALDRLIAEAESEHRTFTITVLETRTYRIAYTVEAATPEEALEKARIGDTVHEDEMNKQLIEVTGRHADAEDIHEED